LRALIFGNYTLPACEAYSEKKKIDVKMPPISEWIEGRDSYNSGYIPIKKLEAFAS